MFGKLIKYEFKSVGKWYLGLYVLAFCVAILLRLSIPEMEQINHPVHLTETAVLVSSLSVIAIVILMVSIFLATLFIIIRRFHQDIYGREGYLTMTLPVSTHQLLLSKLVVAFFCCLLNGIVIFASVGVVSYGFMDFAEISFIRDQLQSANLLVGLLQLLVYLSLSAIREILTIYLAISVGQLFNNRRTLMGFIAYILISLLSTVLSTFLQGIVSEAEAYFFILTLIELFYIMIYYSSTHYLLKNKLNLQ